MAFVAIVNKGDQVFSRKNGVQAHYEPDVNKVQYVVEKTVNNDGITWDEEKYIGNFTGEKVTLNGKVWYKIEYQIWAKYRGKLFYGSELKFNETRINNDWFKWNWWGWFKGEDIGSKTFVTNTEGLQEEYDPSDQNGNGIDDTIEQFLNEPIGEETATKSVTKNLAAFLIPDAIATTPESKNTVMWVGLAAIATGVITVFIRRRNKA